jgi:hypothetical protein
MSLNRIVKLYKVWPLILLGISHVFIWGLETWIYTCTWRGNIKRTSSRNIIIETANIYLPSSNSWWINNTEFEEVKLMIDTSLSIHEEICQLKLWRHILKCDNSILNLWSCKMSININTLSKLMLYQNTSITESPCIVRQKRSRHRNRKTKILKQPP